MQAALTKLDLRDKYTIELSLYCFFMWWSVTCLVPERDRERLSLLAFSGTYSPYKPCNHNQYIGIIIFPHIDNPQSTGYNQPKKKAIKIINEKREGPINLTNHWRKRLQFTSGSKKTLLNPNTETKPYAAIICQPEERE